MSRNFSFSVQPIGRGYDTFQKQDDSGDEHLDSLLKAIIAHEKEEGKKIDATIVTWRGMMTKSSSRPRTGPPLEVMQFWGYKFETISTLPTPWGETSRDYIEDRENHIVSNKEQYCSVVRTGSHDAEVFHRKLMKFWIQSFLLGVPKIIVGFRSREGILRGLEEIDTQRIPQTVNSRPNPSWNADMCVNFAGVFLEWLSKTINDEGVWRIRRLPQSPTIDVFKVEETGHGDILSDEFKNWRIKLSLQ
ncbi:RAT1-interacting protein [Geosmithia morbida]|uniref:Decapping nuclease n=1 Tax=Geosmithia morbida TaxID=1094350 RepID=A0A9P4YQ36_9HYPO|nr:RAT1-interacting protein [Geosmithia morbida]KAF4120507.1 RAT1-interacting protein [Geosmithia morbida]